MDWFKRRKGASLIISMVLSVLILTFSLNMAQTVITTQQNINQAIDAGQLTATIESAQMRAQNLGNQGLNPAGEISGEDYSIIVNVGDNSYRQDVWASTGCPIPDTENRDFGETADVNQPYQLYDDEGNPVQTLQLIDKCHGENYALANNNHYFVYPTPRVNRPNSAPVTVGSDCDPEALARESSGIREINPLEHPCYWGKIPAGESVTIPLNKFGASLSRFDNLKLRLRTGCEDGSEYCEDDERITFDVELEDRFIDDSDLIANWVWEVDGGRFVYGSSRGLENNIIQCTSDICRYTVSHSEVTKFRIQNGSFLTSAGNYLDLFILQNSLARGLAVLDLSTNNNLVLDEFSDLFDLLTSQSNNLDQTLQINNLSGGQLTERIRLEYQLLSNGTFLK